MMKCPNPTPLVSAADSVFLAGILSITPCSVREGCSAEIVTGDSTAVLRGETSLRWESVLGKTKITKTIKFLVLITLS